MEAACAQAAPNSYGCIMLNENFITGLEQIEKIYGTKFSVENWSVRQGESLFVEREGQKVFITYSKDCEFYRAVSYLLQNEGDFSVHEKAHFKELSYMLDCSRNGIMQVEALKKFIVRLALFGYTSLYLYTEDTYEVSSEPYFGHMRGKYTKEEINAVQEQCLIFGLTLVPCIQTLSHLNAVLKWPKYSDIKEYGDTLKVDLDNTYEFIEKSIASCREMYKSDRIHIGMDEACLMAVARKESCNNSDKAKMYLSHLARVHKICEKYHFQPIMWSDMLFYLDNKPYFEKGAFVSDEIMQQIPSDVRLCYWNYYSEDYQNYDVQIKNHQKSGHELMFAGGAWKWVGFVPYNKWSFRTSTPALKACIDNGVQNVMCTAWGDSGDECSNYSVFPVMALYAEMCYQGTEDKNLLADRFRAVVGGDLDAFVDLDLVNEVYENMGDFKDIKVNNSSKYLFYSDLLNSFFDYNVEENVFFGYYERIISKLKSARDRMGEYSYLADTLIALSGCLQIKYDLSIKIKKSYDSKNMAEIIKIAEETIPELIARIRKFYTAFRKQWYREKKSSGFDIQQYRIGALIFRLENVAETLQKFADGKISKIEELEEERLPYFLDAEQNNVMYILNNQMENIVSANVN